MSRKAALLVGCCTDGGSGFPALPAPERDVEKLKEVLTDPSIGDFAAQPLLNEPSGTIREQIERFFADAARDDVLLLYISSHGVLDPTGRLHFVAVDTNRDLLGATGIEAQWVKARMQASRSRRIVLMLDCCHGGAFTRGVTRGARPEEIIGQLGGGRGHVVIAASDSMQRAHDSVFTDAVVKGLDTGAADLDGDGQISVQELYDYALAQVRERAPNQTPTISIERGIGQLFLAKSPFRPQLAQALVGEDPWMRLWAVGGLRLLAAGTPPGLQAAAKRNLIRLRDHDPDEAVRAAALEALLPAHAPPPSPARWHRVPALWPRPALAALAPIGIALAVAWATLSPIRPARCSPVALSPNGALSLGTLLPQSGSFIYYGPAMDAGVRLAKRDIDAAGGIPGITFRLDEANRRDEGDPSGDEALRSVEDLLAAPQKVDAVIGPATSAVAVKLLDKVVCQGVILFSPVNTAPELTTADDHGLYFRTAPVSTLEGAVLGGLVVGDRNQTAVVIARDDVYGNSLRKATAAAIERMGGQVLASLSFNPDAPHLDEDIRRIRAADPDAIVLIGFTESAPILASLIAAGLGPESKRVYGANANMTDTMARQVDPADPGILAGMRGTVVKAGDDAFVTRLKEVDPGLRDFAYAAQAYDAVVVTALAAAVARTDAPVAVAEQINGVTRRGERCTTYAACLTLVERRTDIDYDGVSGALEFSDVGEPRAATYVVAEIDADGKVTPLRDVHITADALAEGAASGTGTRRPPQEDRPRRP